MPHHRPISVLTTKPVLNRLNRGFRTARRCQMSANAIVVAANESDFAPDSGIFNRILTTGFEL